MKWLAKTFAALLVAIGIAIVWFGHDRTTRYCPISHWLSGLGICVVLDRSGDKVLIQHGELDFNVYYFEVRDGGESSFYEFPVELVAQIGPGDYTAEFDPADESKLIVEGQSFDLVPVRPGW